MSRARDTLPARPPQAAPIVADTGTRRPSEVVVSRKVGFGGGIGGGSPFTRRRAARSRSVASRRRVPRALPATCAARLAATTTVANQPAIPSQPMAAQAKATTTANAV